MPAGPGGPIRRAQLIAPFGAGAMVVVRGGTSLISCGLDHWFEREDRSDSVVAGEFKIEEWRLEEMLRVSHFRQPPDYRDRRPGQSVPNSGLTVPFLRFPQWHFCPVCHRLGERTLSERGRPKCSQCAQDRKDRYMFQVPFVAMCDQGHLQDFPWREWVHKEAHPSCKQPLRLISTGSASLSGQMVRCDCGVQARSLAQITEASPDGAKTFLSSNLQEGSEFLCLGHRPWLGPNSTEDCTRPLRGSLRSASNVYFAQVKSAIYLPRGNNVAPPNLVALLEGPPVSTLINTMRSFDAPRFEWPTAMRSHYPHLFQPYQDPQILAAIEIVYPPAKAASANGEAPEVPLTDEDSEEQETKFRRDEFETLRTPHDEALLTIRAGDLDKYDEGIIQYFSRVMLVEKLRETRALAGFTRVFPENDQTLEQRKSMLWKVPPSPNEMWLPAYTVYGEGIYLELDEGRLRDWEKREEVTVRIANLTGRYSQVQLNRRLRERVISPRLLLLHTLAHLIMNRLTFECGYSSAALRERLYVSNEPDECMAGILIYTADGDAEGTMGGLVRMGKPGYLEPVIRHALEGAQWCSADPICMEIGNQGGQGPDSCNLAACHNCSLVPETACEEFNRFLDRGVVVGDITSGTPGFFDL